VVAQVNRICEDASDEAREYSSTRPAPRNSRQVAAAVEKTVEIGEDAVDGFEKVEAPADGRAVFQEFVDAQKEALEANRAYEAAAESGDTEEFGRRGREILSLAKRIKKASDEYGLDTQKCARIPYPFTTGGGSSSGGGGGKVPTPGPAVSERDITGRWSGEATQRNKDGTGGSYRMSLTIKPVDPGAIAGKIRYPTYPCGGDIRFVRREGERYVFKELIRYGKRECDRDATIVVRPSGLRLAFRWTAFETVVTARLSRAGG
jgi:hypothetical protein